MLYLYLQRRLVGLWLSALVLIQAGCGCGVIGGVANGLLFATIATTKTAVLSSLVAHYCWYRGSWEQVE